MIDTETGRNMVDVKGEHRVLTMQSATGNIWMLADLDDP
jgi:hypothetical protein